jgi:hypothetical protein
MTLSEARSAPLQARGYGFESRWLHTVGSTTNNRPMTRRFFTRNGAALAVSHGIVARIDPCLTEVHAANRFPRRSAAPRCTFSEPSTFSNFVITGVEWPSTSWMFSIGTPSSSRSVAHECRRSWNRIRRTPAAVPGTPTPPQLRSQPGTAVRYGATIPRLRWLQCQYPSMDLVAHLDGRRDGGDHSVGHVGSYEVRLSLFKGRDGTTRALRSSTPSPSS